ncbi:hypothetical protein ACIQUL_36115 [Streptomyces sp. NPDC090303]|uniref:hypothetical protein n=1 Tax=Streptomyces sp. NPDC090303 TaxID=3365960 RepID=UPI003823F034
MSRKNTKRMKNEAARRLAAAEDFVEQWTTSGRACEMAEDYQLNCGDAEVMAELFRSFAYPNTADSILADHREDCRTPHRHERRGVWTFTFEVKTPGWRVGEEPPSYTVVANGKSGTEAEERAKEFLRIEAEASALFRPSCLIWLVETEEGAPSSTALYSWLDARQYKEVSK